MQKCIHDVKLWMPSNKLKLNVKTTAARLVSAQRMPTSLPMPDSLTIGTSNVMFSLDVTLDTLLTIENQLINLVRSASFELRRINSIRHSLSVIATQKLVLASVMSRLDYCNCLLYGSPQYLINRPQKVKTETKQCCPPHPGRLKFSKTDHITPHLQTLHWLPLDARIQYKICSLCFNDINSSGP